MRHVCTFFSLVDLLAIVPWYLAAANVQWADDSDELLRLFRVLRLLALDRYSSSLSLMGSVLVKNKVALTATGFVAGLFWLVFSTLLFLTESRNSFEEADMEMSTSLGHVLVCYRMGGRWVGCVRMAVPMYSAPLLLVVLGWVGLG